MVGVTKKASLILAVIFGFAVFFVECSGSEKPPIDIEVTFSKYGHGLYWIDIISNVDSITILSAKINRGNCANNDGLPYFKINKTLRFGDSYQFYILPFRCQHIKEVSIETDKETWNFTFARK
ncbi:hypothetical protein [Helicobacter pylori]|uniref:hypothetical protein n=1 Tax=Helicobacter pylori TaxID=210 RepID=UPI000FDF4176|nr:hypothetical protein [Helicobacter pylori]RVY69242.1 hypothetical protein ECC41_00315 [Helicobacter pylori]